MQRRTALAKHLIEHCVLQRTQAHASETLPALQTALHASWQVLPAAAGALSRHIASQPYTPSVRCFARSARDGPSSGTPETSLQTTLPNDSQIVRVDDWVEVKDEKQNQVYFWNKTTGDTTAVGMPRPDTWTEVRQRAMAIYRLCWASSFQLLLAMLKCNQCAMRCSSLGCAFLACAAVGCFNKQLAWM